LVVAIHGFVLFRQLVPLVVTGTLQLFLGQRLDIGLLALGEDLVGPSIGGLVTGKVLEKVLNGNEQTLKKKKQFKKTSIRLPHRHA